MPHVVSASRRTDIPQFFGEWFAARRKAGFCESRNVFGGGYRISLLPEDVIGWLFWSKNTAPFEDRLRALLDEGAPVAVQFTVNGYGPSVEGRIPPIEATIPAFQRASRMLPSPTAIQWRYDPVVVTDEFDAAWHRTNFRAIAAALEGGTRVCNTSMVEPYLKVVRRMGEGVAWRPAEPGRHGRVATKYPELRRAGEEEERLMAELADVAREHGIELRSCCEPAPVAPPVAVPPGADPARTGILAKSACCSAELFEPYGIGHLLAAIPPGPTRAGCRCLRSLDIGMDNTCPGGCAYCYVTLSPESAARNAARHSPESVRMR